ncbi:MAG: S8 family serine peptidase [Victivallales bacterium]|nr:S8 family serine peptidase [Victivallales bacterium]
MFKDFRNNLRPRRLVLLILMTVLVTWVILWLWGGPAAPKAKDQILQISKNTSATTQDRQPRHRHTSPQTTTQSPVASPDGMPADETANQDAHIVFLRNSEDYQRLRDWAAANGFDPIGEIPQLHALKFSLSAEDFHRLLQDSGIELEEGLDSLVSIPDLLNDKYPEWTGNPGPAFGDTYRAFLGVDIDNPERGHGVTIALLDTALFDHPALKGAKVTSVNRQDTQDESIATHGTAVASILTGETGISNAELLAYNVLDTETGNGSTFDLAAAIVDAVDRGADLISMSLGTYDDSGILHDAVNYALTNNVLLVAAAGNNGVEDVCYPAAYEGVLAVGAIDADGNVSGFSNYGEGLALVAPGVGLQVAAPHDEYGYFSGTSAAVPCVTAVLANYLSANPAVTPAEAYARLLLNCTDTEAPGHDTVSGYGILDAERLEGQDDRGIYDAAAAGITYDDTTGALTVAAQNTGTETLAELVLTTEILGVQMVSTFKDVTPGSIVSASGELPPDVWENALSLKVRTTVSTPDAKDARPRNQTHYKTFEAPEPAEN